MVFFTCNACGESLKKNKVISHYQTKCPDCYVLSCMDCGKDFAGDEYLSHNSCVSEAEKYQGNLYQGPKGSQSKGDKKQQDWIEAVHEAVDKAPAKLKALATKLLEFHNVPRKQKKFINFARNSLNVRDDKTLQELWKLFSVEAKPAIESKPSDNETPAHKVDENKAKQIASTELTPFVDQVEGKTTEPSTTSSSEEKKKKKKKKEKRDKPKTETTMSTKAAGNGRVGDDDSKKTEEVEPENTATNKDGEPTTSDKEAEKDMKKKKKSKAKKSSSESESSSHTSAKEATTSKEAQPSKPQKRKAEDDTDNEAKKRKKKKHKSSKKAKSS